MQIGRTLRVGDDKQWFADIMKQAVMIKDADSVVAVKFFSASILCLNLNGVFSVSTFAWTTEPFDSFLDRHQV